MRTVVVPLPIPASLRQALLDVRAAVNHLIGDWRAHPDESRFHATKRSYRSVRQKYPHLASSWTVTIANETSATLASWDRVLRRMKRLDPKRWDRCRTQPPRRARLKAVLHPALYRLHGNTLDLTLSPSHHVQFDLAPVKNPLFRHYGEISHWKFGLTVTDRALMFHFHTPEERREGTGMVGVDVNMPSADYATTEGVMGSIDLKPITRIQGAMARKRQRVQRAIPTDHRLQRLHLRRLKGRERRRVDPLLHMAANRLVAEGGGPCHRVGGSVEDARRTPQAGEQGPATKAFRLDAGPVPAVRRVQGPDACAPREPSGDLHGVSPVRRSAGPPGVATEHLRELPGRLAPGHGSGNFHPLPGPCGPTGHGSFPECAPRAPGGQSVGSLLRRRADEGGRSECESRRITFSIQRGVVVLSLRPLLPVQHRTLLVDPGPVGLLVPSERHLDLAQ